MISIIVPAYNESKRIRSFLKDLVNFAKKGNYEIKIISYKPNMGKGYAVKTGIMKARGEYIIFIDADGSIHPKEIPKMERMLKEYDIVVGDRSSVFSKIKQPRARRFLGVVF